MKPFSVGGEALTLLKHGMYPMQLRNDENNVSPVGSAEIVGDFMLFNDHADIFDYGYNPTYDPFSPLFFNPTNCEKGHSFMVPQVAATIIAIVNDYPTNVTEDREAGIVTNATLMEDMKDYLKNLNKWQLLRGTTDLNFEYKHYTTEELRTYLKSEEYLTIDDSTNTTYAGVCFGFQLTKFNEANFSATLYFDDQDDLGGSIATGIPNQYQGVGSGSGVP